MTDHPTPHLTDEERADVKQALLDEIDTLRKSSGFSGTLSEKLKATSAAAMALAVLCDGADLGAASICAQDAIRSESATRHSRKPAR